MDCKTRPTRAEMEPALKTLRLWCDEQNFKLPISDNKILRYFVGCKYDLVKTREKLRGTQELRQKVPQWYGKRDPQGSQVVDILAAGVSVPLPTRDEHGATIIVSKPLALNPRSYSIDAVYKVCLMSLDLLLDLDGNVAENGMTIVVDLEEFWYGYVFQLTPSLLINSARYFRDVYPGRLKGLHIINCPSVCNTAISILRKLMPEKLASRVHNYGRDSDKFFEKFDRGALPNDYGGTCGSMSDLIDGVKRRMLANRKRYLSNEL